MAESALPDPGSPAATAAIDLRTCRDATQSPALG